MDEIETAKENSKFFQVSSETGRMSVRENLMPLALAYKERAAFTDTLLLGGAPGGTGCASVLTAGSGYRQWAPVVGSAAPGVFAGASALGRVGCGAW